MARAIPSRVTVNTVVTSRYNSSSLKSQDSEDYSLVRPLSWDERVSGSDTITTDDGETLILLSEGMQSVPQPGWVLLLTGGSPEKGYSWTAYGLK